MEETITNPNIDFGQGRRLQAQLALRSVFARVEAEAYSGCRLAPGQLIAEFEDADAAAKYYSAAMLDFLKGLGAEVRVPKGGVLETFGLPGAEQAFVQGEEIAPFELLVMHGSVPGNATMGGSKGAAHIVEACAEVLRVLLGIAVVSAADDCAADEAVVVLFREAPEFGGKVALDTQKMTGLGRVRCIVFTAKEPRVSYLLGSAVGQLKPRELVLEFPFVEQIYGPNRLRWCDLRAPGYEPEPAAGDEAPKVQVAS